jgi:hypothetical protein
MSSRPLISVAYVVCFKTPRWIIHRLDLVSIQCPVRLQGYAASLEGWHASITAVIDCSPGREATTRTMGVSSPSAR